jgi:hypothetical protein
MLRLARDAAWLAAGCGALLTLAVVVDRVLRHAPPDDHVVFTLPVPGKATAVGLGGCRVAYARIR